MAIMYTPNTPARSENALRRIKDYICDPDKTSRSLIGGIGCPPDLWVNMNKAVKACHNTKHRKQYRHFVLGFAPSDKIEVQKAVRVTHKIAEYFNGCYVVYAVHTNTEHIHSHIIVGNTKYSDGKQYDMRRTDLNCFKAHCSCVLRKFGYKPIRTLQYRNIKDEISGSEDTAMLEIADSQYEQEILPLVGLLDKNDIVSTADTDIIRKIDPATGYVYYYDNRSYVSNYFAPRELIHNKQVSYDNSVNRYQHTPSLPQPARQASVPQFAPTVHGNIQGCVVNKVWTCFGNRQLIESISFSSEAEAAFYMQLHPVIPPFQYEVLINPIIMD